MENQFELFPVRLRRLRERNRLKRVVLSQLCGLDRSAIAHYETGERLPSVDAICAIADYFEVSVDYLIGRTPF
ncbi:MAG: helix-turn-helix transcriptional regulator [Clostridiales bacterium]|jgi:transcriptional regulator with XRE-family HTH domain|nr:helix-turn-helix transcriptional regulator [Clostridiales bacterium]